jgi:hypothetical protein
MHGPMRAALLAAVCLGLAQPAQANDAVDRARAFLAKNDAKAAVSTLEDALPSAGADLGPMIVVLRQAYTRAAANATKAGQTAEADEYRENLQILNRRMRGQTDDGNPVDPPPVAAKPVNEPVKAPPAPVKPPPAPAQPDPATVKVDSLPTFETPAAAPPSPLSVDLSEGNPTPEPEAKVATPEPAPVAEKELPPQDPTPGEILADADRAYLSEKYLDASKGYAQLAGIGQLPAARKTHWAYCRSVDVVRRIKANPASKAEWASIDREISEIKALSPRFWYAEYLRNRAADQSRGLVAKQSKGRVVRGAMPETERPADAIRDLTRKAPPVDAQPPVGRIGKPGEIALPSTETPQAISTHGDAGKWQIKETPNFVIFHADPDLAEKLAASAESARESQTRRWTGSPPPRNWSPRCEIYVYPTAALFSQITGQPVDSEGFSTMQTDGVKTTARRINLRADHATIVTAVLPHEVTHVVLADLFPTQQIPRWADEGIAVLSEPKHEQERRIVELDPALDGGKIFSIEHLMVRDYPEGPHWALYYAQSVSLTRFLVDQGTPAQFIDFLQGSQRTDAQTELRRVYKIDGFADLQTRWLDYARTRIASKGETTRK